MLLAFISAPTFIIQCPKEEINFYESNTSAFSSFFLVWMVEGTHIDPFNFSENFHICFKKILNFELSPSILEVKIRHC